MNTFVPIAKLLSAGRADDHPVSRGDGGPRTFGDLRRDVGGLTGRLARAAGANWLIASEDAYALAVALLAVLHSGGRALFPANLQSGHLGEIAGLADGVLSLQGACAGPALTLPILEDTSEPGPSFDDLDPETCAIQLHTSGSTGRPEAIHKPLRCLDAEVAVLEKVFGGCGAGSVLATVPPYHIYGLLFRVLWPLAAGRILEAGAIGFPGELAALAQQRPAPLLVSSPAFLKRALPVLDLSQLDARLHGIFSSGGPLEPGVAAAYNAQLRHKLVEVYGSTETGGIGYRSVTDAAAPPPWTPLPGVSVTQSAAADAIAVTSPFLAVPGSFVTGDRGTILADGRFALAGRSDRIIKLEERRISLIEIEDRLKACPEVAEARVVALTAGATTGERVVLGAAVVPSGRGWGKLRAGGKRALREILHNALKPHVEALALPRRWRFVGRLPVTPQGKTVEAELAALFEPAMGRRVDPEILDCRTENGEVRLSLSLEPALFYFDGHFDEAPILPGVVQIDWALAQARRHFDLEGSFHRIETLKFFKVLPAGAQVTLALEFDAAKKRLVFSYRSADATHSAGRIKFEPAP